MFGLKLNTKKQHMGDFSNTFLSENLIFLYWLSLPQRVVFHI